MHCLTSRCFYFFFSFLNINEGNTNLNAYNIEDRKKSEENNYQASAILSGLHFFPLEIDCKLFLLIFNFHIRFIKGIRWFPFQSIFLYIFSSLAKTNSLTLRLCFYSFRCEIGKFSAFFLSIRRERKQC